MASELVGLLTEPPPPGAGGERLFRLPHAACEVVCCDVPDVVGAVSVHCAQLLLAVSGLDGGVRASPFRQACISRTLSAVQKLHPVVFAAAVRAIDWEALWGGLAGRMDDGATADVCLLLATSSTTSAAQNPSSAQSVAAALVRSMTGEAAVEPFADERDSIDPALQKELATREASRVVETLARISTLVPARSVLALPPSATSATSAEPAPMDARLPAAGDLGGRLRPTCSLAAVLARDPDAIPTHSDAWKSAHLAAVVTTELTRGQAARTIAEALQRTW